MSKAKITIRWFDGYLEEFDAVDYRFGVDLLWIKLSNGNRHIPTRQVRWYQILPESHAMPIDTEIETLQCSNDQLHYQIDKLAHFIMNEVPGEPKCSKEYPGGQGAIDTAIRVIKDLQEQILINRKTKPK
jgi:hypothetical protein